MTKKVERQDGSEKKLTVPCHRRGRDPSADASYARFASGSFRSCSPGDDGLKRSNDRSTVEMVCRLSWFGGVGFGGLGRLSSF